MAWGALALQLVLTLRLVASDGVALGSALWRYFGYFTILTNLGVALVASAMALGPASPLVGARVRLATVTAIVFVGLTYSAALRATWSPTGWHAVADHGLHDASPLLFLLAWGLAPHGSLRWRDAGWALAPPFAYCLYALARGAADGWYAYWFLDPNRLGWGGMALSVVVLLLALLVLAFGFIAIDRWLSRRRIAARRA